MASKGLWAQVCAHLYEYYSAKRAPGCFWCLELMVLGEILSPWDDDFTADCNSCDVGIALKRHPFLNIDKPQRPDAPMDIRRGLQPHTRVNRHCPAIRSEIARDGKIPPVRCAGCPVGDLLLPKAR